MPQPLRYAQLYLTSRGNAIITPMHFNSAGIYYEQQEVFSGDLRKGDAFVARLREALKRYSFREENLRESQRTDWPAYRASGCRSVRDFEKAYIRVGVRAVNEAELFYDVECQPHGEPDIRLHVTLNPYGSDEEISRLLTRLHAVCMKWQPDLAE